MSRRREKRWDEIEIGMARRQAIQRDVLDCKNKRESVEKNMEKDRTHQKRSWRAFQEQERRHKPSCKEKPWEKNELEEDVSRCVLDERPEWKMVRAAK